MESLIKPDALARTQAQTTNVQVPAKVFELEPSSFTMPERRVTRRRFLDALYRYRWMALALVVLFVAAAAGVTYLVPPYYVADGSLVIERPDNHLAQLKPTETYSSYDEDREIQTAQTEIHSRALAQRVINDLGLEQRDPEIAKALKKSIDGARRHGRQLSQPSLDQIAEDVFDSKQKTALDKLSRTVHVQYGSTSPTLAADVVNATIRDFIAYNLSSHLEVGQQLSTWLQSQLEGVRQKLSHDQQALIDFQQKHAYVPLVIPGGQQSVLLQQLIEANRQLTDTTADRIASQALLQVYPGSTAELPSDLRTPAIDQAVTEVTAARKEFDTLSSTYQPNFPLVQQARERVNSAEARLQSLTSQVQAGLQKRYSAANQREAELNQLVSRLNSQAAGESATELQYQVLKNNADSERQLLDSLTEKLNEAGLLGSMPSNNLRPLDTAVAPLIPVYPNMTIDLALGLLLGMVVAGGAVLARDSADRSVRPEQLNRVGAALSPLAVIPDRDRVLELNARSGELTIMRGSSRMGESYAKLAANVAAYLPERPRTLLVTSALPGEGKTMTTCNLGLALGRLGWKTLIIDADLRRAGCHRFFGVDNRVGLLTAQRGDTVAVQAVAPHLDLLACEVESDSQLNPSRIGEMLNNFASQYEFILVDTPPGNLTGDAVLLSRLVKGVLVVLRWGKTNARDAQQLYTELVRVHAPLLGTVLNRIDFDDPEFRHYREYTGYYAA